MKFLQSLFAILLVTSLGTIVAIRPTPAESRPQSGGELRNGDLIFRSGYGIEARISNLAGGRYSHVGVILWSGGAWRVVHAIPGETHNAVRVELVEDFIAGARQRDHRVMRVRWAGADARIRFGGAVRRSAASLRDRDMPYDYAFDLEDPSRVYCTELVWRVLREAGVDLLPGTDRSSRAPVFPDELMRAVPMDRVS